MAGNNAETVDRIRETAHEWRTLMTGPHASDADRKRFEEWRAADPRHEEAYDRAITIYAALGTLNRDDYDADCFRPSLRERILTALSGSAAAFLNAPSRLAAGAVAVAALAVGAIVIPHIIDGYVEEAAPVVAQYSTGVRETRRIALGDGTVVTIGAGSELETSYTARARNVRLISGAALFDVVSDADRPFSVHAGRLTARAVGTAFDVRNSGGVYRVAVAEGRVRVSFPYQIDGRPTGLATRRDLAAGEQVAASAENGLALAKPIETSDVGAWRSNRLVYDGATIAELVADANRYDDRVVVIAEGSEDIASLTLTGAFSGDNIDRMLMTLADVHSVTVDASDPGAITLRRRDEAY